MSDSLRLYGLQTPRLLSPWDSPGRNTGVGCHSLLQGGLSDPGMEPGSPALQVDSLPSEPPGKPIFYHKHSLIRDTSLQYCYKGPEFSRYHKKSRKVVCKIRGRQPLQNVHLKERGLRSCFQILALLFAGPMNSRGLISTCVTRRVSISELLRGWYERVYIKSLTHTWHSTT